MHGRCGVRFACLVGQTIILGWGLACLSSFLLALRFLVVMFGFVFRCLVEVVEFGQLLFFQDYICQALILKNNAWSTLGDGSA